MEYTVYDDEQSVISAVNRVMSHVGLPYIRPKKTRGWEHVGACPNCKLLTGNGGDDRFVVWPDRPVESTGGPKERLFYCRRCNRPGTSQPFAGDLVGLVMVALGLKYYAARQWLNLPPKGEEIAYKEIKPRIVIPQIPCQQWRTTADSFVRHAIEALWSEQGKRALKYLTDRGLTRETIENARLGYVPEEQWEDPEKWGETGSRMHIARGIVFPEFHDEELWSVSIRRSDIDILMDDENDAKYLAVRGSVKLLYNADTIKEDLPVVVVEGQIDALTVAQQGRGEFAGVATQSATGAQDVHSLLWLQRSAVGAILCFDPDEAGASALPYWIEHLDKYLEHTPPNYDLNTMHQKGEDVYGFLDLGRRRLQRIYGMPSEKPIEALVIPEQQEEVIEDTEPITVISESIEAIDAMKIWGSGCSHIDTETGEVCSGEVLHFTVAGKGLCEFHYSGTKPCMRCSNEGVYKDQWNQLWCKDHFACKQFLEAGEAFHYAPLPVPPGKALVKITEDDWIMAPGEKTFCPAGAKQYQSFALRMSPAQIWNAYRELHLYLTGAKKITVKGPMQFVCYRADTGCIHSTSMPVQYGDGDYGKRKLVSYYGQQFVSSVEGILSFCARCTPVVRCLELAEARHWQGWATSTDRVEAGEENWLAWAKTSDIFAVIWIFDDMRRTHPDLWKSVVELV